jgi:hypothetical protein
MREESQSKHEMEGTWILIPRNLDSIGFRLSEHKLLRHSEMLAKFGGSLPNIYSLVCKEESSVHSMFSGWALCIMFSVMFNISDWPSISILYVFHVLFLPWIHL